MYGVCLGTGVERIVLGLEVDGECGWLGYNCTKYLPIRKNG